MSEPITIDEYASAARAIALHLREFCNTRLTVPEMITEAARQVADEIERLRVHLMRIAGDRPEPMSFHQALEHLINHYGVENGSDTPDFILANYVQSCLDAFSETVRRREQWYGRSCGNGAAIVGPPDPDGMIRLDVPVREMPERETHRDQ